MEYSCAPLSTSRSSKILAPEVPKLAGFMYVVTIFMKDSKEKSLDERDRFYGKLQTVSDRLGWRTAVLHPEHISNCMLRKDKYNLNTLSHDTVYGLIQSVLDRKVKITHVLDIL